MAQPESSVPQADAQTLAALREAANRSIAAGRLSEATALLRELIAKGGHADKMVWMNLAGVLRAAGQSEAALQAVEEALKLDPRLFIAHLMKGALLERSGKTEETARHYGLALGLAPPPDRIDGAIRAALQRARDVHNAYVHDLRRFVRRDVGLGDTNGSDRTARRIGQFIDMTLGLQRNYRQEPSDFFYPGLPAIGFYDRELFPWLPALEDKTDEIREELEAVLGDTQRFSPYIQYPDSVPLDQWATLNNSPRWSAFHLYHFGTRYDANCAQCPKTMDTLESLPQPVASGRMPAAMFSVLRPKTHIPAHTGVANVRLVVHLPLIVPDGCRFRVGHEVRPWRVGEAWVFDDTVEHEAWNDSERDRVVLIFDVWSPFLSETERTLIVDVMRAIDKHQHRVPASDL